MIILYLQIVLLHLTLTTFPRGIADLVPTKYSSKESMIEAKDYGMHYMHLPTWSQHTALSLVAHRLMLDSHWSILRKELAMCGLDNPLIIQNTLTQAVNGDH